MNFARLLFIFILTVIIISRCQNNSNTVGASASSDNISHYVSIDGLWRCTPETALKFPEGTLEPIIKISGSIDKKLSVIGCFLWDSLYYDEWELGNIQFIDSTKQLIFIADNGSTYKGILDEEMLSITGTVYTGEPDNPVPEDKLDFARADVTLSTRLFNPRPPDLDGSSKYTFMQPVQIEDGLQTASIFEFTNDSTAFYGLMARIFKQKYGHLESLLILKDQKLILEEYYYGYDRTQLHNIHSCTKSVTSLLLGMAMEENKTMNVDQPIFNFFPQYDSLKTKENEQITLKHLLTMTAGLGEHEELNKDDFKDNLNNYLSLPMESIPGETFRYCNDCSNIIGWVIHSLVGKKAHEYSKEVLFGPLGIIDFQWETENGIPHCESDLNMISRDMAKIGLLVLNDGKWQDKQVVPKEWIKESTKVQVSESKFYNYGFHWWNRSKDNAPWWKETEDKIESEKEKIIALGYGGQYIIIIKDLNMVVVTTASDYGNGKKARSKIPMIVDEIVPLFAESAM